MVVLPFSLSKPTRNGASYIKIPFVVYLPIAHNNFAEILNPCINLKFTYVCVTKTLNGYKAGCANQHQDTAHSQCLTKV